MNADTMTVLTFIASIMTVPLIIIGWVIGAWIAELRQARRDKQFLVLLSEQQKEREALRKHIEAVRGGREK